MMYNNRIVHVGGAKIPKLLAPGATAPTTRLDLDLRMTNDMKTKFGIRMQVGTSFGWLLYITESMDDSGIVGGDAVCGDTTHMMLFDSLLEAKEWVKLLSSGRMNYVRSDDTSPSTEQPEYKGEVWTVNVSSAVPRPMFAVWDLDSGY